MRARSLDVLGHQTCIVIFITIFTYQMGRTTECDYNFGVRRLINTIGTSRVSIYALNCVMAGKVCSLRYDACDMRARDTQITTYASNI